VTPNDNYDAVTSFLVKIRESDGLTYSTVAACPGTNPAIFTCNVDMSDLVASPFLLTLG
jgi:hypothetical protein